MASASDFLISQSIQPCELTSVTPPREPSGVDGYRARTGPRSPESGPVCLPLDWLLPAVWVQTQLLRQWRVIAFLRCHIKWEEAGCHIGDLSAWLSVGPRLARLPGPERCLRRDLGVWH